MKKIWMICFLGLMGCQTEFSFPQYYDSKQTITFDYPKGMTLSVDGNEIRENLTIERSADSIHGKLSKEGYEDKDFEVESFLTNDKWATDGSAIFLLPPTNTIKGIFKGLDAGSSFFVIGPLKWVATPVCLVVGAGVGLTIDAYNLVIGIPSVLLANPWYEYDSTVDLSDEVLTAQ